jgi:hypothetical protein
VGQPHRVPPRQDDDDAPEVDPLGAFRNASQSGRTGGRDQSPAFTRSQSAVLSVLIETPTFMEFPPSVATTRAAERIVCLVDASINS